MQYRTLHMPGSPDDPPEQHRWDPTGEPLTLHETRVLGCLIEKEKLTPDNYPLTLNSLTAACNQKTSREPVLELTESEVAEALDSLREKRLVNEVIRSDSRVNRYRHVADMALNIKGGRLAALCVLMLRGPQTPGEIRSRTGRLHEFSSLEEVQDTLDALVDRPGGPLVVELERQPGSRESRFVHLLSGTPEETPAAAAAPARAGGGSASRLESLETDLAAQRQELDELKEQLDQLRQEFSRFRQQFE